MNRNILISGLAAALISAAPLFAQSADDTTATTDAELAPEASECSFFTCALTNVRLGNPLDPSTWWDGAGEVGHDHPAIAVNPFDPEFLMMIPDPSMHSLVHASLTNPENWAQFMKPDAIIGMFSKDTLANWTDPATFDVLTDPQTYAYWMQPGAYQHLIDTEHYAQMIDPTSYMNLFSEVAGSWMSLIKG